MTDQPKLKTRLGEEDRGLKQARISETKGASSRRRTLPLTRTEQGERET
jgi:hypothetical protein